MMSFFEDHIDDYIFGKLDEATKRDFEQLLSDNPDLKKKFEQHKELVFALKSYEFKNQLSHVIKEGSATTKKPEARVINLKMAVAIAASLLLVVFAANQIFFNTNNSSSANQLFYADPGLPTPMSETKSYDFYDAMVDYKAEKYQLAFDKWSTVDDSIGQDTVQYYKAMALYNLEKYNEANEILYLIESESDLYDKSRWYLVGSLLNSDDKESAKEVFNQLSKESHEDYELLKEIIEK